MRAKMRICTDATNAAFCLGFMMGVDLSMRWVNDSIHRWNASEVLRSGIDYRADGENVFKLH
jgi:hypothetical protein